MTTASETGVLSAENSSKKAGARPRVVSVGHPDAGSEFERRLRARDLGTACHYRTLSHGATVKSMRRKLARLKWL